MRTFGDIGPFLNIIKLNATFPFLKASLNTLMKNNPIVIKRKALLRVALCGNYFFFSCTCLHPPTTESIDLATVTFHLKDMKEYILSQCEELEPLIIVDAQWGEKRNSNYYKTRSGTILKKWREKKEVNRPYFGVLAL